MGWTIVGHERVVNALTAAKRNDRVAHAYLFAGPAHVGKTLAALQFAQLLNCDDADAPCGACKSCERIASGKHADVEFVGIGGACDESDHDHAKDNSRDIRICQVRRIEHLISRAPFEGKRRVIVIEPAQALNGATIDPNVTAPPVAALLKTLEEPPAGVVFILVTDQEEMMPATIRSRARLVSFGGLPREQVELTLRTRWDADPETAAGLARLAGGRLGEAVLALRDEKLLESRESAPDKCEALAQAGIADRFSAAATLGSAYSRNRADTQATLELWQVWWRDVLLIAAGREDQITNSERIESLRPLAAHCGVAPALRALKAIGDARQQLLENANPTLTLEAMMLGLPRLQANAVTARLR